MAKIVNIKSPVVNLTAATKGYKENVIKVCTYVSAVAGSQLPSLHHPFKDWDKFSQSFTTAKTDALAWTNNVLAHLLQTPRDILDFNDAVLTGFSEAVKDAEFLIMHPTDKMTIEILSARLKKLTTVVSDNKAEVAALIERIQKFASDLPKQAQNLESLADKATKEEKVDQQKVKELNDDIDRLKSDIANLTGAIVGLGIADAVCITLGIAAVVVAGPLGLITWPFLGIAMAAATTFIVLDSIKIKNDQDQIQSDQHQINEYTQDAAQLKAFANMFKSLADEAVAIQANLQQIIEEWTNLEGSIQSVLEDLVKAKSEMSSQDWKDVKHAFEVATSDWEKMIQLVGPLNITINANNAQIKPGMSADDVKAAMTKGKTMGFIEYINQAS